MKEARDRQWRRRRRWLFIVASAVVVAVAGYGGYNWKNGGRGGPSSNAASADRPAGLPHQPGWYVGQARVPARGCPRCVQTSSWASTIPFLDGPNDFPQRTMVALGQHDVIVQVTRAWQPSVFAWMMTRRPLRIVPARIHSGFEGNPTHNRVSQWSTATWRAGSFVSVYVFFGSPHPTAADVARAEHELAATRFPRWSIRQP